MDIRRDTDPRARFGRRRFLRGLSLAATIGLLGAPRRGRAEPPPETTTIRLFQQPPACYAPLFVAEPLLLAEGFQRVEYVR